MLTKISSPVLEFGAEPEHARDDLSAVLSAGGHLWLASDEATSVERLSTADGLTYNNHKSFPLGGLINLPAAGMKKVDQEIDIEGLAFHDGYLWLVGSHSIKRKNAKKSSTDSPAEGIEKLGVTETRGNRFVLARVPVATSESGEVEPRRELSPPGNAQQSLTAGQLRGDESGNELTEALKGDDGRAGDPHLEKSMSIPGKENGFDIEGLALVEDRIFLGLRGPVLRGWATILEIAVDRGDPGLALRAIGPNNQKYRKHFLQLDGLGIRELIFYGPDLLILAGPSMDLDGPVSLFKWRGAAAARGQSLVWRGDLEKVIDVPFGKGADHPEGITLMDRPGERPSVLIVYDSPGEWRVEGGAAVRADVFELPW